jgi:hypothetical protein
MRLRSQSNEEHPSRIKLNASEGRGTFFRSGVLRQCPDIKGGFPMAGSTGTSNPTYNLVSVLYHALQGAENYEKYAADAGSDQDLASFFREIQQQEIQRADRAKQLLSARLQQSG